MGPTITPPSTPSSPSSVDTQDEPEVPVRKITLGEWTHKGSSNFKGSFLGGHQVAHRKARIKTTIINKYPQTTSIRQKPVHSISGNFLPHFTGRTEELRYIRTLLETSDGSDRTPSYCVMWGMAGVGKTALVHEYLDGVPKHISQIWLQASTEAALDQSVLSAIEKCYPQDRDGHRYSDTRRERLKLKCWLEYDSRKENQDWILVLDDVHDKTCSILQDEIVPTKGSTCKVIATTRSRLIAEDILFLSPETIRCREIKVLDRESATKMFTRIWKFDPREPEKSQLLNEMEKSRIADILNAIDNLPLAVEMAAKYAKLNDLNLAWKTRSEALTWKVDIPHYRDHPRYRQTPVLENAFDFFFELKQNPKAAEAVLLDDLSFYNPTSISVRLFEKQVEVLQSLRQTSVISYLSSFLPWSKPEVDEKYIDPDTRVIDLIRRLERLSFLTQQSNGREKYLSIHKLVQDLNRKKLREELNSTKYTWQRRSKRIGAEIERLHHAMGHSAREFGISKDSIQYKEILSHIASILKFIEDVDEDSDIVAERIFQPLNQRLLKMQETVALWLWECGQYDDAAASARETLPLCQKVWGLGHPVTLRSRNMRDLRYQGYYEIAEAELGNALKHMEKSQKQAKTLEDKLDFVARIDNYAALLRGQGRYTEAFRQCQNARDTRQQLLGTDETLRDHDNFALVYQCLGLYNEARKHSFQALQEREQNLPIEHIDTLACLHQYATILHCQGQYEDAKREIEQALQGRLQLLGEKHPDTLASNQAYASVLHAEGKYQIAADCMEKTLNTRRIVLRDDHPDTLSAMDHLAVIHLCQGKHDIAKKEAESVYERRRKVLGEDHPDTLISMRNLASVYRYQGCYVEAERLYTEVCKKKHKMLKNTELEHIRYPEPISCLIDKAWIDFIHGRYARAGHKYEDAMQRQEMTLGSKHPDTLATLSNLSLASSRLGKYKEAKAAIGSALLAQRDVLEANHPDILSNLHNYSVVLRLQGLYEEAECLGKNALVAMQQILGSQHPDVLSSLDNYASTLRCLGHYPEAEKLCKQALHERQTMLGDDHPDTLCSIDTYSLILQSQHKDIEAAVQTEIALNYRREKLADDHPDRLLSWYNYVWTLQLKGKHADAQVISKDVLDKRREAMILPDILSSAEQTGRILLQARELEKAEELLREAFEGRKELLGKEHTDTLTSLAYYCLALVQLRGSTEAQNFLNSELATEKVPDLGQTRIDSLSDMKHTARAISAHLKGTLKQIKIPWQEAGEYSHTDQRHIMAVKELLRLGKAFEAERKLQLVCTHPDEPSLLALALLLQGKVCKEHNLLRLEDLSRVSLGRVIVGGRDINANVGS